MGQRQIYPITQIERSEKAKSIALKDAIELMQIPSFAWFLSGSTLTNIAQWIQKVTLNWLVYDLTSSGVLLGALNLVSSIATVGLAPFAGVVIDRFSRRKLLYATNAWLLAISFGFGLALLGNSSLIWPLFVFSFLGGIGQALSIPLSQTVVFSVAPRSLAPNAVALVQTGWALMRSIGPAIGGFLILWFGPAGNFFAQAAAYTLVLWTVFKLRMPYEKTEIKSTKSSGSFREGWNYVVSHPTTLSLLLMSWVLPLFIVPNFNALPPIYAKDVFSGGPGTLGLLLGAIGTGGVIGGLVINSLGKSEQRGELQLGALLLLSLSLIAFAFTTKLWMGMMCLSLAGFFEMIFLTTNMTLLQLSIPSALRGRVMGIVSLRYGLSPIGAFIAGLGADMIGPSVTTIILSVIAGAIALIVFFSSPTVREYGLKQALGQSTGD